MLFNNKNMLPLIFIQILLSGCAISNEGATDYRKFSYQENGNKVKGKFIKPAKSVFPIKPGEPLVAKIKQVFIKSFTEFRSPLRIVRGEPANGEMVLLVNAFERGKQSLDFGPDGKKNARVVFFSDDVWEGQFLNLGELSTIYGPLKYEGNPFIIDLYAVELDTPGEQQKQLIANLASIGSTFYPPASPLVGPLAKLANTFITDDQDDRAYHYALELYPIGGNPQLNTSVLEVGDWAFIREANRHSSTNWKNISIDERTGRLIYTNTNNPACDPNQQDELSEECYYKENSYFIIEINTAPSSLANDTAQMIYSSLANKLSGSTPVILKESVSNNVLNELANGISEIKFYDSINQDLKKLEAEKDPAHKQILAIKVVDDWCAKNDNKPKNKLSDQDGRRLEELLLNIVSGCKNNDLNKTLSTMNDLKDRENCSSKTSSLVQALSCSN